METLANFQKFHPPTFNGHKSDPMVVESWVDSLERLFLTLRVSEKDRVTMAVPLLDNVAHRWWKAELERRARTALPMPTWEEFKELFFVTYFSDSAK